MHYPSFSRKPIFKPELYNMNQRTLLLAKLQMLEGGEHEEVVFRVHINIYKQIYLRIHGFI